MEQLGNTSEDMQFDFVIDITKEICPLTFVKTKLLIEKMQPGQIAQIRLRGSEPMENIPRSVKELGHTILSLEPENRALASDDIYNLVVRKEEA